MLHHHSGHLHDQRTACDILARSNDWLLALFAHHRADKAAAHETFSLATIRCTIPLSPSRANNHEPSSFKSV
jgi:hypothetical protein